MKEWSWNVHSSERLTRLRVHPVLTPLSYTKQRAIRRYWGFKNLKSKDQNPIKDEKRENELTFTEIRSLKERHGGRGMWSRGLTDCDPMNLNLRRVTKPNESNFVAKKEGHRYLTMLGHFVLKLQTIRVTL